MSMTLNLGKKDAEKVIACIKGIAGSVSEKDIVEIVLKTAEPEKKPEKSTEVVMTSKEVAEVLGRGHAIIFKKIAKFLCTDASESDKQEFRLTSFRIPQGIDYPMYEMTEKACNLYCDWLKNYTNYKTVSDGAERLKKAIRERFHPEQGAKAGVPLGSDFLLEGKPKKDYEEYCDMFNQFITGPAVEGREIAELTERYKQFYEVMKQAGLKAKESNDLESAMFGVAIEAEMQGFIYGFKMFDALLNRQLATA